MAQQTSLVLIFSFIIHSSPSTLNLAQKKNSAAIYFELSHFLVRLLQSLPNMRDATPQIFVHLRQCTNLISLPLLDPTQLSL
jgi:hypothetical protein